MGFAETIAAIGFFTAVIVAVTQLGGVAKARIQSRAGRLPDETAVRLERIEAAVDVIALEIERISEGQRFLTRVLADSGNPQARALLGRDGAERRPAEQAVRR